MPDSSDNCLKVANANQLDADSDGYGNACDGDLNNDGIVNSLDLGIVKTTFGSKDPRGDVNGDGIVNAVDLGTVKALFSTRPGPSAWHTGSAR